MKYINYLVLLFLLLSAFFLKDSIHISTNLLSLFASKENLVKLDIADKLGYSKEMLIAVKGLNSQSKEEVKELVHQLKKLPEVTMVQSSIIPTKEIQEYYKNNYYLLADFNTSSYNQELIHKKLQGLYEKQLHSFFYTSVSKNDPLEIFSLKQVTNTSSSTHKGTLLTLGEYGYLIRVRTNVSASDMNQAKLLYDKLANLFHHYSNITAFAPFFYTVENSAAIKADVSNIVLISTFLLFFVYYILIRNIKLLFHTVLALASSMLFATLLTTTLFENFHILSLAFGISLSAVSIDYLLHYYFHDFYTGKSKFDKDVFYGFLTTVIAFGILSFIPIRLISQISIFSVFSLSFAYVIFTFVFPYLKIQKYEETTHQIKSSFTIKNYWVFVISLLLYIYTFSQFHLDTNLRNLDYQNTKLQVAEKLFKTANENKLFPVIVEAKNKEELLERLELVKKNVHQSISFSSFVLSEKKCQEKLETLKKYDFNYLNKLLNEEANDIGFKKDYFKESYKNINVLTCELPPLDMFKIFSLSFYSTGKKIYTIALVDDKSKIQKFAFVSDLDVKKMFQKATDAMYKYLTIFGGIVLVVILLLLYFTVQKRFLYALNYILFPSALSMAVVTTFYNVNIMHLFALIILVAIGIDYGIYMSNSHQKSNTMKAIYYSLLSTFSAFGVLVFSQIIALNSIGFVISIGCIAVFFLIKVMK